jgi:pSer/pThr/pTyr-binding forkhead associated (FHA) protein
VNPRHVYKVIFLVVIVFNMVLAADAGRAQANDLSKAVIRNPDTLKGKTESLSAGNNRVALVFGNGGYHVNPLKNPVNDVRKMTEILTKIGFSVTSLENADQKQMEVAIRDFGRAIKGASAALFYYSGHGVGFAERNYLIPIGADIQGEEDISVEGVDVNLVLSKMAQSDGDTNIVILDACRNNPFARRFRSTQGGLTSMQAPTDTIIAYATAPGRVASDGYGENGLYTGVLIKYLQIPGYKIEDVFKQVRREVQEISREHQIPWEHSSLIEDFYFLHEGLPESERVTITIKPPPTNRAFFVRVGVLLILVLGGGVIFWFYGFRLKRKPTEVPSTRKPESNAATMTVQPLESAAEPVVIMGPPPIKTASQPIYRIQGRKAIMTFQDPAGSRRVHLWNSLNVTLSRSPEDVDIVCAVLPFSKENEARTMKISRRHCRLFVADDRVCLRDINSTFGTMVDGRRLKTGETAALESGREISLAGVLAFRFREFRAQHDMERAGRSNDPVPNQLTSFKLRLVNPDWETTDHIFLLHELIIGSGTQAAVSIQSPSLADRHARITVQNHQFYMEDLGASQGTRMNGESLTPRQAMPIENDSRIIWGRLEAKFRYL